MWLLSLALKSAKKREGEREEEGNGQKVTFHLLGIGVEGRGACRTRTALVICSLDITLECGDGEMAQWVKST